MFQVPGCTYLEGETVGQTVAGAGGALADKPAPLGQEGRVSRRVGAVAQEPRRRGGLLRRGEGASGLPTPGCQICTGDRTAAERTPPETRGGERQRCQLPAAISATGVAN